MSEQRFSLLPLLERHLPENDEAKALLSLLAANLQDFFRPIYLATLMLDSSTAKSGVPLGSDLVVDDAR